MAADTLTITTRLLPQLCVVFQFLSCRLAQIVGVLLCWKSTLLHLTDIRLDRLHNARCQIAVLLYKFVHRLLGIAETQHVMPHQHLPIAMLATTDTNRGNVQQLRDVCCGLSAHFLQHQKRGASVLNAQCFLAQLLHICIAASSCAKTIGSLRHQSQVCAHRHKSRNLSNNVGHKPFELDTRRTTFTHQSGRIAHSIIASQIRAKGHITHYVRTLNAASDCARVMHHRVQRHLVGVLEAHDHVCTRVAHQNRVNFGAIRQQRL
mmetsp:Transcript_15386/g.23421  ORF Transcript_15386/g.23421 Transcript_15386/m.23421 type:complete len:263 (+) Transcript_15386:1832-2620(+)